MDDFIGSKFGRLTVVEYVGKSKWRCVCECGNESIVYRSNLTKGNSTSCGCYRDQRRSESHTKHGGRHTRLYTCWVNMRNRCKYPSATQYKDYGGRGIKVCDEWQDFSAFQKWAVENGYTEDLTLDRIDVDGDYCPSNCRWVDDITQANNTRANHYIEYNGEVHTIAEWSRILNIDYDVLESRLNQHKWSVERAFTQEVCRTRKVVCIETNEIFDSGRAAAIAHNLTPPAICKSARYGKVCSDGTHWRYV